MLAAYNTIASGGRYVAPRLIEATIDANGHEHPAPASPRRQVVSATVARQMTTMLGEVVRVGTGQAAAIADGYTVAGKTGTARKPLTGARGYMDGVYVSSFAGFVPAERPALTAIVIIDETPQFGGAVAAPVFADIARYGLREFRIPPAVPTGPALGVPLATPSSAQAAGELATPPSVGAAPGAPAAPPRRAVSPSTTTTQPRHTPALPPSSHPPPVTSPPASTTPTTRLAIR